MCGDHIQNVGENIVAKMVQSCKQVAPLCIVALKIKDDMLPKIPIPMFANLSSCGLHVTAMYVVLKGLLCSNAHFKSRPTISHQTEGEVGGGEHKKSQAIGCEMVDPDLKCAFEHNNPLSTRYVSPCHDLP
jgi:hypothetical protein